MSSIIRVSPSNNNGFVFVMVDAEYGQRLHDYLRERRVGVTALEGAVYRTIRAYVDKEGRRQIESETLDMAFEAKSSIKDFENVVGDWLQTLQ